MIIWKKYQAKLKNIKSYVNIYGSFLERAKGFEPSTSTLARLPCTNEHLTRRLNNVTQLLMIKEIDKLKEPPKLTIKFANMVFTLGILFSILLVVYAIYKIYNPPELVSPAFYIFSMLCGGVFAALFGHGLKRLSNNLRVSLSLLFFTTGISVYGFETYLEFSKKNQREIIAKQ